MRKRITNIILVLVLLIGLSFSDTLTLEAMPIEQSVERVNAYTDLAGKHVIETEYTYDGMKFVLRVDVDAVQTHNAADAKMSAWGTQG